MKAWKSVEEKADVDDDVEGILTWSAHMAIEDVYLGKVWRIKSTLA